MQRLLPFTARMPETGAGQHADIHNAGYGPR